MNDENINKYHLLEPLQNANAGFAKWGFAEKDGHEYFIKEFLDPVYPSADDMFDTAMQKKIVEHCLAYQLDRMELYKAINKASDGNLVRVEEFFRWGSRYYIVSNRIKTSKIHFEDVYKMDFSDRLRICRVLTHALMKMHILGVVHADIKPDNILLTDTSYGQVTAKIIDIDGSFFEGHPPEEIIGDQVYFAPETILYMFEELEGKFLSCKIDVFSMGLILHQILAGGFPSLPDGYQYAFEACLDGNSIGSRSSNTELDSIHSFQNAGDRPR